MDKRLLIGLLAATFSQQIYASDLDVKMTDLKTNKSVGYINISTSPYGIVLTPHLNQLSSGLHGFHIHQNGDCGTAVKSGKTITGGAAGGHYDPDNTGQHGFPWTNNNHKGDLPALYVNSQGNASNPVLAPRLTIDEIKGKSIMIHMGSDNHSDHPKPLGGGGSRMVCGVIQ